MMYAKLAIVIMMIIAYIDLNRNRVSSFLIKLFASSDIETQNANVSKMSNSKKTKKIRIDIVYFSIALLFRLVGVSDFIDIQCLENRILDENLAPIFIVFQ